MKRQPTESGVAKEVPAQRRARIQAELTAWFRVNKRDLPWRGGSAYAVWVSEIMLQQTQVATVIPFYQRFMERFPTIEALASAPVEEVLRYWSGLGYYARARNLHRAAKKIVAEHGGLMPEGQEAISALPGIGRYTAGAILSIVFDRPYPLVDANVTRVLCRVFGLRGDPKSAGNQATLWAVAEQLVPVESPGDFNQGLMELGALVCRTDDPLCERCPLLSECQAGNSADPTALPETAPGRATVNVTHSAAIIIREDESRGGGSAGRDGGGPGRPSYCWDPGSEALLVLRPPHGLWGGLWEFPRVVCERGEDPAEAAVQAAREVACLQIEVCDRLAVVKHSVTHHRITLHGFLARETAQGQAAQPIGCAEARWVRLSDLHAYGLSAPQSLLREALLKGGD